MSRLQYLLLLLMEECAEVSHRSSKLIRFGPYEKQSKEHENNESRLKNELNDIFALLELLEDEGLEVGKEEDKIQKKKEKIERYYKYSKSLEEFWN